MAVRLVVWLALLLVDEMAATLDVQKADLKVAETVEEKV